MTVIPPAVLRTLCDAVVSQGLAPQDWDVPHLLRSHGLVLGKQAVSDVARAMQHELYGAGALQPLLDDPQVTDVVVNGPDQVWVDRGRGMQLAEVDLGSLAAVRELAVRLAGLGGRRLDDAHPVADARLPDGTRLHAVLPPVAEGSAVLSLRTHRQRRLNLVDLEELGAMPPALRTILTELVHSGANLMISGGTGTGKTTLLAALLEQVATNRRIICIEEARELALTHPHAVYLSPRPANTEGQGEISLAELVRASVRMRPDVVVLGECRGTEVREVLGAMNTGHVGLATVHANTAQAVVARIQALAALAGLSPQAANLQFASAIDVIIHVERLNGVRFISQLSTVLVNGDQVEVVPAITWHPVSESVDSHASASRINYGSGWPSLQARIGPVNACQAS